LSFQIRWIKREERKYLVRASSKHGKARNKTAKPKKPKRLIRKAVQARLMRRNNESSYQAVLIESPEVLEEVEEKSFVFEFYEALKSYEVLPLR